jgi:hypothetical protein
MELRHCGNTLKPVEVITFCPAEVLLIEVKVEYFKARLGLLENFNAVDYGIFECPGNLTQNSSCVGEIHGWIGTRHDGTECCLERLDTKGREEWQEILKWVKQGKSEKNKKGASAVQGSKKIFPFTFREMVPV